VDRVERIDKLIGRAVVSLETANKLGEIADLLIDRPGFPGLRYSHFQS
jgi:uncharacterized protein YrrD